MAYKPKRPDQKNLKETGVKLIADPKFEFSYPRYYANHVEIRSTPFDFSLRFCEALPIYEVPVEGPDGIIEIKIPIKAEIVIPKDILPALIKAMQDNYDRYIEAYKVEAEKKLGKK